MLYWIIFLLIATILTAASLYTKFDENIRNYSQIVLILVVVCFSGFRDGLGQDYAGYYDNLKNGYFNSYSFFEPAFSFFSNLIYYTVLSPQFFFLVTAIVTNYLFLKSFYRYENTFLIIFIYLTGTIFYFNTFNLVRQMCAASIFMYSIKYIETRKIFKYQIFVLIAASIHVSAIFLVPIYFIVRKDYSKKILFFILGLSIFIGQIEKIDLSSLLSKYLSLYYWYFADEIEPINSGYLTLFFNVFLILMLLNKKSISKTIRSNISFNLFFIGVVLYNLIPSFYFIFRFAVYFIVFAPIVLPHLEIVIPKLFSRIILIGGFGILFGFFLFSNLNNKIINPNKILLITSIFDK